MVKLPPLVAYPPATWRRKLSSAEWEALQEAWITLLQAHSSSLPQHLSKELADEGSSLLRFLTTFAQEAASCDDVAPAPAPSLTHRPGAALRRAVYQLLSKLVPLKPASSLDQFEFVVAFAKLYPKKLAAPLLSRAFASPHAAALESSLTALKRTLVTHLDAGVRGDLSLAEARLTQLNPLLHASPDACTLFLAGDDFVDGLIAGYRVMNPPLRRVIVVTLYLGLIGLVEAQPASRWSMLSDRLFSLAAAAEEHKQGPLGAGDSLVPALVTSTPLLRVLLARAEAGGTATDTLRKRIAALDAFRTGAVARRPTRLKRRGKPAKGKDRLGTSEDADAAASDEIHVHRLSQITQVQDLFPDLGAGFVAKCLEEYGEDVEQVVASLLSESLPPHLATADRGQGLCIPQQLPDLAPHSTPPPPPPPPPPSQLPARRNIHDDDELDRLAVDMTKLSFGKRPDATADQLLQDRPAGPATKAAILSALAAFDSDDDERDDTYDAADVGGTVDASATQEEAADGVPSHHRHINVRNSGGAVDIDSNKEEEEEDKREAALFGAYRSDPRLFDRSAATRRSAARGKLREATGMTDEALEGWSLVLARDAAQMRRLEAKYAFRGQQQQTRLDRTAWRATAGSGAEESNDDNSGGGGGGNRGRGGRGRGGTRGRGAGGRGGGGGGHVAGPTGDKGTETARRKKEASKGSRANHDRKAGHAKKMARGGGFAG